MTATSGPSASAYDDVVDLGGDRPIDVDNDRTFHGRRRLQGRELAGQEAGRHEVAAPFGEPFGDNGLAARQEDQNHIVAAGGDGAQRKGTDRTHTAQEKCRLALGKDHRAGAIIGTVLQQA